MLICVTENLLTWLVAGQHGFNGYATGTTMLVASLHTIEIDYFQVQLLACAEPRTCCCRWAAPRAEILASSRCICRFAARSLGAGPSSVSCQIATPAAKSALTAARCAGGRQRRHRAESRVSGVRDGRCASVLFLVHRAAGAAASTVTSATAATAAAVPTAAPAATRPRRRRRRRRACHLSYRATPRPALDRSRY